MWCHCWLVCVSWGGGSIDQSGTSNGMATLIRGEERIDHLDALIKVAVLIQWVGVECWWNLGSGGISMWWHWFVHLNQIDGQHWSVGSIYGGGIIDSHGWGGMDSSDALINTTLETLPCISSPIANIPTPPSIALTSLSLKQQYTHHHHAHTNAAACSLKNMLLLLIRCSSEYPSPPSLWNWSPIPSKWVMNPSTAQLSGTELEGMQDIDEGERDIWSGWSWNFYILL